MIYLILVSIIWALSFSLIKGTLTGIDSNLVAFIRLAISFLIFLPFLKIKLLSKSILLHFFLIGLIQYGLMYITYIYSYKFLDAYQIAVLTIFTPLFVVFIYDFWNNKFSKVHLGSALLAVLGAAIIVYTKSFNPESWKGILLIQISNFCFALGQVYFKQIMKKNTEIKPIQIFSILYLGAVFITGFITLLFSDYNIFKITSNQWLSLCYLGIVASGIGFFLWNIGVTKVNTKTLAVFNNLKIPFAVLFAYILLEESINPIKFFIGSGILIFSLYLSNRNNLITGYKK